MIAFERFLNCIKRLYYISKVLTNQLFQKIWPDIPLNYEGIHHLFRKYNDFYYADLVLFWSMLADDDSKLPFYNLFADVLSCSFQEFCQLMAALLSVPMHLTPDKCESIWPLQHPICLFDECDDEDGCIFALYVNNCKRNTLEFFFHLSVDEQKNLFSWCYRTIDPVIVID